MALFMQRMPDRCIPSHLYGKQRVYSNGFGSGLPMLQDSIFQGVPESHVPPVWAETTAWEQKHRLIQGEP